MPECSHCGCTVAAFEVDRDGDLLCPSCGWSVTAAAKEASTRRGRKRTGDSRPFRKPAAKGSTPATPSSMLTSHPELDALMHLTIPDTRAMLEDLAGVAEHCIDATRKARSYRTRCVARGLTDSGDEGHIEWNMEYCRPDRFHVTQEAHPGGDYDEWIAIGDDVWCQPFWFHRSGANLPTGEHSMDSMLSAEPYLKLLSEMKPSDGFKVETEGRSLEIVEFNVEARTMAEFIAGRGNRQALEQVPDEMKSYRLWIEHESGLLQRADTLFRAAGGVHDQLSSCLVFSSYNEQISIEPPSSAAEPVTS